MTEPTQILSIIALSLPKLFGLSHLLIPKTKITKKQTFPPPSPPPTESTAESS